MNAGWIGSEDSTVSNTGTDTGLGGLGSDLAAGAIPASISDNYDGFLGGAQVGYNWDAGAMIFGLEADFDGASAKASTSANFPGSLFFVPFSTSYIREVDWLSTVRGRVGVALASPFLLYATGGLAIGEVKIGSQFVCPACLPPASTEVTTANTTSTTAVGWTAGAGAEWLVTQHWSVKAEYLYVDLGSHNSTITYTYGAANTSSLSSSVHDTINIARAGVNYHF